MEVPRVLTVNFRARFRLRPRLSHYWLAAPGFLAPALALYSLFVVWPVIQVFWLALQHWDGYGPQHFTGLANLMNLCNDGVFRISLVHSIFWLAGALIIAPGVSLGLALAARHSRGPATLLAILFFPALLPATVLAALAILIYSPLSGLLNWSLGAVGLAFLTADWLGDPHLALGSLFLIWLWSAAGIGTILLWVGIQAVGHEYLELASTEGASSRWQLWHVVLPGIQRTLFAVIAIDIALAAQAFDLVYVTTGGGPGYATMLLPVDMYSRAFGGQTGEGAAVASIQVLLVFGVLLALYPLWQRAPSLDNGDTAPGPRSSVPMANLILLVASAATLFPLAWLPFMALQPGRLFALNGPDFAPGSWTLANIDDAWNTGMPAALKMSTELAGGATLLVLILTAPAAFAFLRPFRWRAGLFAILLLGMLQPTTVIIIPLFALLRDLGLLNSVWGILLPEVGRSIPFGVMITWGYLAGSSREIFEAAAVDGASPVQQLLKIAVPLARPALFAVVIWTFITSWNEYLLPTIVSQDGSISTVPTVLASFAGTLDTQVGTLAAGSLLAMVPSVLIYITLRRFAAGGLRDAMRRVQ